MIRLIHRYKESVGIVFLVVAVCFAFSGIGLDMLQRSNVQEYAIKIDDREISYQEVRNSVDQLSRQYGTTVPTDRVVDRMVSQTLIEQESLRKGFRVSNEPERIKEMIIQEYFRDGSASKDRYLGLLQQVGMSPPQFEQKVRTDRLIEMYVGLLTDVSFATSREAKVELAQQDTEYTVAGLEIKAEDLIKDVPAPSEDELRKHFEATATEYELPARASYDYLVLDPKNFKQMVPVTPQDVEIFFSENANQFVVPEKAKLRVIKILYPKDSDPEKMVAVREKAAKAHEEALSGKPFEGLVTAYSEDFSAKATGGDIGWIETSKLEEPVGESVSKLKAPGIADLVELDYGFQIVKVEEFKESSAKSLGEVTAEIEDLIREREAPSFANAEAHRLLGLAKQGKSITDLGAEAKFTVASTNGQLEVTVDPTPELKGLTAKVISLPADERTSPSLHDIDQLSVIVAPKEIKDPETAAYDTVKEKVTQAYIKMQSQSLAETKVAKVLEKLRATPTLDLSVLAKESGFALKGPSTITRTKPGEGWLGNPQLLQALYKVNKPETVLNEALTIDGAKVIAKVTTIKRPEVRADDPKIEQFRGTASQMLANQVLQSTLATIKAGSNIDINNSLMAE